MSEKYEKISPFKWQLLESFPFIAEDFDQLTEYALYCKLVEYMNKVIDGTNTLGENVEEYITKYNALKEYVDDYFENLDVQDEIDNKLNEMAQDGTISNILNNELFSNINNQILQNSNDIGAINEELDDTIKTTDTNVVSMTMLTQEVREALTGGSTAVVGVNSVNSENIVDKAINIYKFDELIQENYTKEFENVAFGNYVAGNGKYISNNAITNLEDSYVRYYNPTLDNNTLYQFVGFNYYQVNAIIIYDPSDNNKILYYTPITNIATRFENVKLLFKTNKSGLKAYINTINQTDTGNLRPQYQLLPTLTKIKEITQNKKENYIEKVKDIDEYYPYYIANPPTNTIRLVHNTDVTCKTSVYKLSKGTKYHVNSANVYANCGLVICNEKMEISYTSTTENVGNRAVPFSYEFTASDDGYALLMFIQSANYTITSEIYVVDSETKYKSKKWTIIGDSLSDATINTSIKKYYSYVQDDLQITIQNVARSGSGYKRTDGGNTFVQQSLLVDSDADVVTIFGSFNDHNIYDTDGLGNVTDTTTDSVFGCVYTTFQNLITNRPNAKIGVILPTPWNYNNMNPHNPTQINLDYIEGIKTIAKKFSIPVLDLFYESNMYPWDSNFRSLFYLNGDGTHPNTEGNERFAYQIEEFIKKLI